MSHLEGPITVTPLTSCSDSFYDQTFGPRDQALGVRLLPIRGNCPLIFYSWIESSADTETESSRAKCSFNMGVSDPCFTDGSFPTGGFSGGFIGWYGVIGRGFEMV